MANCSHFAHTKHPAALVRMVGNSTVRRLGQRLLALATTTILSLVVLLRHDIAWAQSEPATAETATSKPQDAWTYYGLSKWHVDKREPVRSIPSPQQRDRNPLEFGYFLMDVSDLAEAALKRGNHAEAIVYFKTLAAAVPENAVSYRKICKSYQALEDWQDALVYCKEALTKQATFVGDFTRYADIMLRMNIDMPQAAALRTHPLRVVEAEQVGGLGGSKLVWQWAQA